MGGGLLLLAFLLRRRCISQPGTRAWTAEDIEYLARVLILETGLSRNTTEMIGIAWVAVNRALGQNRTIKQVVATTGWPGGGQRGDSFVEAIQMNSPGLTSSGLHSAAVGHPNIGKARALARQVLFGKTCNPIKTRTNFVHPEALSSSLPSWSIAQSKGGTALDDPGPLWISGALFSLPANTPYFARLASIYAQMGVA